MSSPLLRRRLIRFSAVALLALGVLWKPWSGKQEIDLNSGDLRHTRCLLGVKVYESVRTTPLSQCARAFNLATAPPRWKRVSDYAVGLYFTREGSVYEAALYPAMTLDMVIEREGLSIDEATQITAQLLTYLRHEEPWKISDDYIQVERLHRSGRENDREEAPR